MNPRYHIAKRKYIYDILKSFVTSFFIMGFYISVFFEKEEGELLELTFNQSIISTVVFFLTLIVQLILYWLILKRHLFSNQEESFLIEKGLFFKRRINIPYKNIHTLSIKRRFKDIILGLSCLQIDTGTTSSFMPEANIVLDKSYAPILKQYIEKRKTEKELTMPSPLKFDKTLEESSSPIYQVKWFELLLMGILKKGFLMFVLIITAIFFGIVIPLSSFDPEINRSEFFGLILIIYFSLIIAAAVFAMLFHLIIYFDYQISFNNDSITYKYGLLSKAEFKLPLKRINAIHINQSVLYRIFEYYQLNISAIGIGEPNEDGQIKPESKSLLPIVKKEIMELFLKQIKYSQMTDILPITPKSYKRTNFVVLPLIFITLLIFLPFLILELDLIAFLPTVLIGLIAYILIIMGLVLRLRQHHFKIFDNIFVFQRGSFTLKKTYIKKEKIQSLIYHKNPILILEKIGHIQVKYKDIAGRISMKNFEPQSFDLIKNFVLYE